MVRENAILFEKQYLKYLNSILFIGENGLKDTDIFFLEYKDM
jgi:hypothetical protein